MVFILVILALVLVLLILLGILAIKVNRNKEYTPNYYNLFIMGLIWIGIGIPLRNSVLSILGAVFLISGLLNKDKWQSKKKTWKKMSKNERNLLKLLLAIGIIVLAIGIAFFCLSETGRL